MRKYAKFPFICDYTELNIFKIERVKIKTKKGAETVFCEDFQKNI